ncbi:hypothetical protein B0H66DRAFT_533085 [Apodospora peruviana]|uniref:Uncharacterized protein n=1 Tax=Apodospora peruviana TaxID=516989 RepID=A0AAE0I509_9PEZI|nr:hypothetical protein B0H66DRAFT_533085 [Apodospora peruviana]
MADSPTEQQQQRQVQSEGMFSQQQPQESSSSPALPFAQEAGQQRRGSAEWDASKVPPSRFQKRKGSIYAVPSSRDGHIDSNYASKFHEKHAEKGYSIFGSKK